MLNMRYYKLSEYKEEMKRDLNVEKKKFPQE